MGNTDSTEIENPSNNKVVAKTTKTKAKPKGESSKSKVVKTLDMETEDDPPKRKVTKKVKKTEEDSVKKNTKKTKRSPTYASDEDKPTKLKKSKKTNEEAKPSKGTSLKKKKPKPEQPDDEGRSKSKKPRRHRENCPFNKQAKQTQNWPDKNGPQHIPNPGLKKLIATIDAIRARDFPLADKIELVQKNQ